MNRPASRQTVIGMSLLVVVACTNSPNGLLDFLVWIGGVLLLATDRA
jgi:hypothetical protein